MMTQNEMILKHLEEEGSITSLEAMQDYGVMRLASRITDLRKMGIKIRREMIHAKNRFGGTVIYARYSLDGEPNG